MKRKTTTLLLIGIVITSLLAVPLSVNAESSFQQSNKTNATQSDTRLGVGGQISVFMASQTGEIEKAFELVSFKTKLNNTSSNVTKAETVRNKVEELKQRKSELKEQRKELKAMYKNGSISRIEFVSRMTSISTSNETVSEVASEARTQAEKIPKQARQKTNINMTALNMLKENASSLSGQQVAEIAKSINQNSVSERGQQNNTETDNNSSVNNESKQKQSKGKQHTPNDSQKKTETGKQSSEKDTSKTPRQSPR